MKLTLARKYEKLLRKTQGILYQNPLLSLGLALPLAVIPSYNLIATTAVSLSMLICFVPTVLLASLLGKRITSPWRAVVYPLVSCLLLIPTRMLLVQLFPMIQDTLGIYLSLICVNSLLMYAIGKAASQKPLRALGLGLRMWLGASLVAFVCGAIRELCATGSLFGITVLSSTPRLPIAQMAMGGFILLAFLAALCRTIHRLILTLAIKAETSKGGEED